MRFWKNYHRASNIEDALRLLEAADGPACPVAGGTDLLLDLQQGRHAPVDTLVDVTGIPALNRLEVHGERLYVGAAVPLSRIVRSALVNEHASALVEASQLIGGPQVRNTATLGGNVAHALPAADGTIAMMALDAQVRVASKAGRRWEPLAGLFLGPGVSALDLQCELVVGFSLPLRRRGQASAFSRVMRPQGVALPILNLAAWLDCPRGTIEEVRLAVGPSGPTPRRALRAEQELRGGDLDDERIGRALDALLGEVRYRTSPHRASATYRRMLTGVLLRDALTTAWNRAQTERVPG